jgi:hypothetical protein
VRREAANRVPIDCWYAEGWVGRGCTGCDTRVSVCALPAHSGRAAAGLGFASLEPPPRAVDDEHPAREAAGERERYTT